jgi:transmembrane sensor
MSWIFSGALAAGLVVAVLLLPFRLFNTAPPPVPAHFATKVGENQTTQLADGSTLLLGADSRVTTAFDERARRVVLEQGEAFFRVTHDSSRPFIVLAGTYSVTAIGTAFNVRKSADRVVVSVAEGTVAIGPSPAPSQPAPLGVLHDTLRANAGQAVMLDNADQQLQILRIEPQAVAVWQGGRLEFAREPLRAVITSVNRYAGRQVMLENAQLGELRFTGTVFADRVEDWIQGLPEVFPVTVRDEGVRVVIAARQSR